MSPADVFYSIACCVAHLYIQNMTEQNTIAAEAQRRRVVVFSLRLSISAVKIYAAVKAHV